MFTTASRITTLTAFTRRRAVLSDDGSSLKSSPCQATCESPVCHQMSVLLRLGTAEWSDADELSPPCICTGHVQRQRNRKHQTSPPVRCWPWWASLRIRNKVKFVLPPSESLWDTHLASPVPGHYDIASTKPETRNVSQRCRKGSSHVPICTENLVKYGLAVPVICAQTDTHTDRQTRSLQYFASYWGGVIRIKHDSNWVLPPRA